MAPTFDLSGHSKTLNFFLNGTDHNQELLDWHLPKVPKGYQQLKEKANYEARLEAVKEFNKMSKRT